jgi:hypothetical protein
MVNEEVANFPAPKLANTPAPLTREGVEVLEVGRDIGPTNDRAAFVHDGGLAEGFVDVHTEVHGFASSPDQGGRPSACHPRQWRSRARPYRGTCSTLACSPERLGPTCVERNWKGTRPIGARVGSAEGVVTVPS